MGTKVNPGRQYALDTLIGVDRHESIERAALQWKCTERDRALAWHIVYGVLRRRGQLDEILHRNVKGGLKRLKPLVLYILRIGLFEVLFSRTPTHAAISQAVELTKRSKHRFASGLVNAVLRKSQDSKLGSTLLNAPEWLQPYFEESPDWLVQKPKVHIALAKLSDCPIQDSHPYSDTVDSLYTVNGSVINLVDWPGYEEGQWWIMDPAAARVVDMGVQAIGNPKTFTAIDCCAAPGGKTWRLISKGARVTSTDLSEHRLEKLREGAKRLKMSPIIQQWDWSRAPLSGHETVDLVLVDAPCSGTGVIRRHPEIRWNRKKTDILANQIIQRQIISNASQLVKPNGVLVYSVCSILPQEGLDVANSLSGWSVYKQLTTYPTLSDEDGFQIFVLKKDRRND